MSFNPAAYRPFEILGIENPNEATRKDVKRAYARELKKIDQAKDLEAFQRLRSALEDALEMIENEYAAVPAATPVTEPRAIDQEDVAPIAVNAEDSSPNAADAATGVLEEDTASQGQEEAVSIPNEVFVDLQVLEALPPSEEAVQKICMMLDDPRFMDLELNKLLGLEICRFLERAIDWESAEAPRFYPVISIGFIQKLDSRFQWCADYRALSNFTPEAEVLHTAMFLTINGISEDDLNVEQENQKLAPIDSTLGIAVLTSFFGGMLHRSLEPGSLIEQIVGYIVLTAVVIVFAIIGVKLLAKFLGPVFERLRDFFSK